MFTALHMASKELIYNKKEWYNKVWYQLTSFDIPMNFASKFPKFYFQISRNLNFQELFFCHKATFNAYFIYLPGFEVAKRWAVFCDHLTELSLIREIESSMQGKGVISVFDMQRILSSC